MKRTALKPGAKPMRKSRPKMTAARKAAKGQPCMVRIPGVCNRDDATVVLAHFRMQSGAGMKPEDQQAAFSCSACHDLIDGRTHSDEWDRTSVRLMHAEGVFRTQMAMREKS